jgi:hypothetical protein
MQIIGGCHCGNIKFTLNWPDADGNEIPVRVCRCSFCVKHGGAYTSHRKSALEATVADEKAHIRYRFGTGTADFHICSSCGVVPFVTSEIDDRLYAVVNANSFDNIEPSQLSRSPSDFDGESTVSRLERRQRNWIPAVSVTR